MKSRLTWMRSASSILKVSCPWIGTQSFLKSEKTSRISWKRAAGSSSKTKSKTKKEKKKTVKPTTLNSMMMKSPATMTLMTLRTSQRITRSHRAFRVTMKRKDSAGTNWTRKLLKKIDKQRPEGSNKMTREAPETQVKEEDDSKLKV